VNVLVSRLERAGQDPPTKASTLLQAYLVCWWALRGFRSRDEPSKPLPVSISLMHVVVLCEPIH
jgi:uncharacterized membrane protein (UPF0136 family)